MNFELLLVFSPPLVPVLALVVVSVTRAASRGRRWLAIAATLAIYAVLWCAVTGYGFLHGEVSHACIGGTLSFVLFCLPFFIGELERPREGLREATQELVTLFGASRSPLGHLSIVTTSHGHVSLPDDRGRVSITLGGRGTGSTSRAGPPRPP